MAPVHWCSDLVLYSSGETTVFRFVPGAVPSSEAILIPRHTPAHLHQARAQTSLAFGSLSV